MDARFDRAGFESGGEALARELGAQLATELPREADAAAGWLAALVGDLAQLGHELHAEDIVDDKLQVWGDYRFVGCNHVGHDLALFVWGTFEAGRPTRIDRVEVTWQRA